MYLPTYLLTYPLVCFLPGNFPASEFYMRHIKFRRREITRKKTYNIQNTAKA